MDKSKQKMIEKCSKFQIGGIPKHRSQEHLFTIKSILSLYLLLNLPIFMQLYDISKYFEKEILKDAMDTLYSAGIKGKLYRLWYELYKDAQIRVKTGAGMTAIEATGESTSENSPFYFTLRVFHILPLLMKFMKYREVFTSQV